jgi:hypothetical protein
MKQVTSTLSALSSSILLNVGLTRFAEKLDPIASNRSQLIEMPGVRACSICAVCSFGARRQG